MAKLIDLGVAVAVETPIRFVGAPKLSNLEKSRDGQSYWEWAVAKPVLVRCSTDKTGEIPEYEAESLFVRDDIKNSDLWEQDKDGYFIPGYVCDHSTNHEEPLFLDQYISEWSKGRSEQRREDKRMSNIDRIRKTRKLIAGVTSVAEEPVVTDTPARPAGAPRAARRSARS